MNNEILFFLLQFVTLYFIVGKTSSVISGFIYRIVNNKKFTYWIFAILFLPGTVLHELSHYLTAVILFVPVGKFEIKPQISGNNLKMGSVSIAKVDLIRRTFIGLAPVIVGFFILYLTSNFLISNLTFKTDTYYYLACLFIIFQAANGMFLSKSDLEAAFKLVVIVMAIFVVFYLLKLSFPISYINLDLILMRLASVSKFLYLPILLDLSIIAIIKTADWLF